VVHAPDGQVQYLIEVLLAENPRISASWSRSRSGFERAPQARSLPDPQISYRYYANPPETRVGPQEHTLEYAQSVPWGGKRALQAKRAELLASGTTWEAEDLERKLVAALKRAYFEAAYLQEALTVNSEEEGLLRRFESIALRRYSTGEGIQQSVVKVQTDISRLSDRETALRERLDVMTQRIAELIGRPEAPLSLDPIRLPLPQIRHDREDLVASAVSRHPRIRALEQHIEADRVWAERRKLEARPDFRFGLGYTLVDEREDVAGILSPPEDNGKDVLGFTVGINIPLFRKRIRAGVAEARESQRAREELQEAVRDRLRFDIEEALLHLDSLGERGRLYRDVIVPLVSDFWIALADLELAAGQPFPEDDEKGAGSPS
jgi:outer membrane protein TolC